MRLFVLSGLCSGAVKENLSAYGTLVLLSPNRFLNRQEGSHADMQLFKIKEREAIAAPGFDENARKQLERAGISVSVGTQEISPVYPQNIAYNVLQAGEHWFHHPRYTAAEIREEARRLGKKLIPVRQGYSACSSVYFPFQNLILSGDNGIISAAKENNYEVYRFPDSEKIVLDGYAHGFIGGCCCVLNGGRTLLVNGNLAGQAPETARMLAQKGIETVNIGEESLTDIGGMAVFTI